MSRRHTPAADQPIATMQLFAGLNRRQRRRVAALSTIMHCPGGDVLARQGQFAQELIVIVSGHALATIDGKPAAVMPAGSHVGASVLVGRARHTATVTTVTPTDVLVFAVADIRDLVAEHPTVRTRLEATDIPEHHIDTGRTAGGRIPPLRRLVGSVR